MRSIHRTFLAALAAGSALVAAGAASAQEAIKVGVLHSLSGTMAISETTLKDVMLMLVDEQNKKGGLLGKKLEAVVVDPASNWPLFAEKARELITREKVAATFGRDHRKRTPALMRAGQQIGRSVDLQVRAIRDDNRSMRQRPGRYRDSPHRFAWSAPFIPVLLLT